MPKIGKYSKLQILNTLRAAILYDLPFPINGITKDEVIEYLDRYIASAEKRAAYDRAFVTRKREKVHRLPEYFRVLDAVPYEYVTIDVIMSNLTDQDKNLTSAQVAAYLVQLITDGLVDKKYTIKRGYYEEYTYRRKKSSKEV